MIVATVLLIIFQWMKFPKFYQVLELFFKHLYLIKNYLCMTI